MSIYVTPGRLPLFVGQSRDIRQRNTAQIIIAGIALVQTKTANSGAAEPATLDVVLDTPAIAGNLLVVAANSDSTLTAPSGFSTAASAINNQGTYLFYKVAAGGETTITTTVNVARPVAVAAAEYSGITATSPLDQTASNTGTGSTAGPVSTGTTSATTQNAELILAVGGPHSFTPGLAPNTPTWTNGFTTRGDTASGSSTSARNSAVFLGELIVSTTGAQSSDISWTQSANDWGALVATFKGA